MNSYINSTINPYDPPHNGEWNIQLFLARYKKKTITLIELMEILEELFRKFPYAKDYTISTISFGSLHTSSCIDVDHERRVIIIK